MSDERQLRTLFEETRPATPHVSAVEAIVQRLQREPSPWAWRPMAAVSVALLVGIVVGLWGGKAPTSNAATSTTLSSRLWSDASGGLSTYQEDAR